MSLIFKRKIAPAYPYLQETLDYQTRVTANGGTVIDMLSVDDYYYYINNNFPYNLKFLICYKLGLKITSADGIDYIDTMYDLSIDNSDITQTGANTYKPKLQSVGMQFDGNDNLSRNSIILTSYLVSFVGWFNVSGTGNQMLWDHKCDTYATYFDLFWLSNTLYMNSADGSTSPFKKISNNQNVTKTDIPNGQWHQLGVVFQDASLSSKTVLYLDGIRFATANYKDPTVATTKLFSLGGLDSYYTIGLIGQMAIFDTALSVEQMSGLYNLTRGKYQ